MKVLQISNKVPFPPIDGGAFVIHSLTQGLWDLGHDVHMFAIIPEKLGVVLSDIPKSYRQKASFQYIELPLVATWYGALANLLFSKEPYQLTRFVSKEMAQKIAKIVAENNYDVIQLESIYVLPYLEVIRANTDAPVVLRTQNVESHIWKLRAKNEHNLLLKWYFSILSKRLERYEFAFSRKVDQIIAITPNDAAHLSQKIDTCPIKSIPMGVKWPGEKWSIGKEVIFYNLSAMTWFPNVEAMKWFLKEVWTKFHRVRPDVVFNLAGVGMPGWAYEYKDLGVVVQAKIKSPEAYIRDKTVLVVPLLSGSGIRVKILEALINGKMVICSSLAAAGIDHEACPSILIANTPDEYIQQMTKVLDNPKWLEMNAPIGRRFVETQYSAEKVAKDFVQTYAQIVAQKGQNR